MKQLAFLLFAPLFSVSAFAQSPATGFPMYGSFQQDRFDAVNRWNLNVNFAVPIVSAPARGGNFQFNVAYNSLIWTLSGNTWSPVTNTSGSPTWGWNTSSVVGTLPYETSSGSCTYLDDSGRTVSVRTISYFNYAFVEPSGTLHPFDVSVLLAPDACGGSTLPQTGYATDGSGYYLVASPAPTVYSPAGIIISNTGTMTDTNGNYVSRVVVSSSETDWKDTVGRISLKIITNTGYTDYQYLDNSGTYQTIRMNLATFQIKTNFGCSAIIEYTGSASLPVSIVYMANNTSYSFTYEDTPGWAGYKTGRLKRVTLPTGGYYEYQYPATPNNGINCADGNINSLTRVLNDGTTSNTWQYARTQIDASNWKTTVSAPQVPYDTAANQTTFTFTNGKETSQKIYQGSESTGTLLRTINTAYAANGSPASKTVILENNQQAKTETDLDTYANLLATRDYDWGTGAPGAALRTTTLTYLSASAYTSRNILNRVTQTTVREGGPAGAIKSRTDTSYDGTPLTCVSGAAQHDDTNYGCTFTARGNPTTVTQYTDAGTPSGAIVKSTYYDSLGNLTQAPADCCVQKQFNTSATTQYAFPESVVSGGTGGSTLTSTQTYNSNTGLVAISTDENWKQTTYTYDALKRLTDVGRPDGSHVYYSYDDVGRTVTVRNPIQGTDERRETSFMDGLGRTIKRQVTDAAGVSYSIVETQYDALGRPYRAGNPHNSTAQYWTETRYDALGRTIKVIPPDGSPTSNNIAYVYSGNTLAVSDPAGKQRKSQFDGAGRLSAVFEPDVNNNNTLTQQTSYTYTVWDALATVTQGSLTRTYVFDGIGRVASETTPESGTVSYQYNDYSLVTQRTDARGVVTSYAYDNLNRRTGISYNVGSTGVPATASVTYTYGTDAAQNNNGRLLTMTDGVGSETYSYDVRGRVTQTRKVISGTTYTIGYAYNLDCQATSITYPSGRTVQQVYDAIGRLSSITSGSTVANGFSYNPAALVTGFNYGNGVAASFGYTSERQLLQSLSYTKSGQTLFNLTYGYAQGNGNNGQVTGITDAVDSGRSVTYIYDVLGRISTAVTTGSIPYPKWGLSWNYDRYGNRWTQAQSYDAPPTVSLSFSQPNNRPDGFGHDASGDMQNDGLNSLQYDAEQRLISASGNSYNFDGNNLRVKKQLSGGGTGTVYIFDGTRPIAEYENGAAPGSPTREYVSEEGKLLVTIEGGATRYHHHDHLSIRLTTDSSGISIGQQGHFPFGETWYTSGTTTKFMFTTYERDSESGNDYAVYRSYVNRFGRFPNPDPLRSSPAEEPRAWNRYSYVFDDPVNGSDPSGLWSWQDICSTRTHVTVLMDGLDLRMFCVFWPAGVFIARQLLIHDRPPCPEGTQDCSFYEKKCKEVTERGSSDCIRDYYCRVAPKVCRNFPKFSPWGRCMRKCLQDKDNCYEGEKPCDAFRVCETVIHGDCTIKCRPCRLI